MSSTTAEKKKEMEDKGGNNNEKGIDNLGGKEEREGEKNIIIKKGLLNLS